MRKDKQKEIKDYINENDAPHSMSETDIEEFEANAKILGWK